MTQVQHVTECYTCGEDFATKEETEAEWRCPICLARPKLRFHYSMEHANKVLKLVIDILEQEAPSEFKGTISAWANCREQGYHLAANYSGDRSMDDHPKLVFAQQRSSDGIVVIWGNWRDFCGQTNAPTDDVWKRNRKDFGPDAKAARFIADTLMG